MEEANPDEIGQFTRASKLLRKSGLKPDEANELTELISNMASTNVISRLESKIDAQNAKYTLLIWAIGFATVILSAVILFTNYGS